MPKPKLRSTHALLSRMKLFRVGLLTTRIIGSWTGYFISALVLNANPSLTSESTTTTVIVWNSGG